jgi:hypothetical protein
MSKGFLINEYLAGLLSLDLGSHLYETAERKWKIVLAS